VTPDPRTERLLSDLAASGLSGPSIDRLVALVERDPDAYRRTHYHPGHVTGSAFVVSPGFDAIGLALHAKIGIWVQPGGHVEPGDPSVEAGARREMTEEVGVSDGDAFGLVDVDIHDFPAHGGQPAHLHFDVRYLFRARTDLLGVGDGVTAVRWVPLEEAQALDPSIARPARRIAALGRSGG
jgi:8-oxo-dGTP pyrophosphatase MutT (NUDIX family)